jgi:putative ABC transport system substrate-binding protein
LLITLAENIIFSVTGFLAQRVEDCLPSRWNFAREIVPGASRVALLTNLEDPKAPPQVQELEVVGRALGVKIVAADAGRPDKIDDAMQALANQRIDVVIVLQTTMLLYESRQIAALALAKRLPTVYGYREHVVAGGLISYGVDLRWCFHGGACIVEARSLRHPPAKDIDLLP